MSIHQLSLDQIKAEVEYLGGSSKERGVLEYVVLRLPNEKRETPQQATVSPEGGLHGDRWGQVKTPNPRAQISMMNSRLLRVLSGSEERMSLAGDNLLVDFDLSEANLPAGTTLKIGTATFEVTDLPHTGCKKFEARYGADALKFVNSDERWRGLFVKVIEPGEIQRGDEIGKVSR